MATRMPDQDPFLKSIRYPDTILQKLLRETGSELAPDERNQPSSPIIERFRHNDRHGQQIGALKSGNVTA
jgi:hypothetical protein